MVTLMIHVILDEFSVMLCMLDDSGFGDGGSGDAVLGAGGFDLVTLVVKVCLISCVCMSRELYFSGYAYSCMLSYS